MSKYTMQLGYVVKQEMKYNQCNEIEAYRKILGDYPIFDENYRDTLNRKIIEHYYMREIGQETPSLFKFFIQRKMREIMPYYNQLYKSETIDFNPLFNIDITESYEHTVSNEQSGKSNADSENNSTTDSNTDIESRDISTPATVNKETIVNCDTPQEGITQYDIDNNTYVTNYSRSSSAQSGTDTTEGSQSETRKDKNNSNSTTSQNFSNSGNTTESYIRKTLGSSAGLPFSKAIKQWRDIMINIDMKIIEELKNNFMLVW